MIQIICNTCDKVMEDGKYRITVMINREGKERHYCSPECCNKDMKYLDIKGESK